MKMGANSVKVISDGTFMLDGGVFFGQIPKVHWESHSKPDRRNRVRLSLNCLLVQTPQKNILIDSGVGSKRLDSLKDSHGLNGNKLMKGLKEQGLGARDIDIVLLTDLHFTHIGGCTKLDRSGEVLPTFPKAEHLIQKASWDDAIAPNERMASSFHSDDFVPIADKGLVTLLDGDTELAPGINVKVTGGPSVGHQVVFIESGSHRVAYAGDLIPSPHHLSLPCISSSDYTPNDSLAQKRELLDMAAGHGWMLVFGHALEQRAGYVELRNGRTQFQTVEL